MIENKKNKFFTNLINKLLNLFNCIKSFFIKPKIQLTIFLVYIFSFISLITIRELLDIYISKYIFVFLYLILNLFANNSYALFGIAFTLPFFSGLPDLYYLIITVFSLFIRFLNNHTFKKWILILIIPVTISIYEMIISSFYGGFDVKNILRLFSILAILSLIFFDYKNFNYKHILAFTVGFSVYCLILGCSYLEVSTWALLNKDVDWLTFKHIIANNRFSSKYDVVSWLSANAGLNYNINPNNIYLGDNSNNLGLFSLICCVSIYSINNLLNKKEKIISYIIFIILLFFGIFTMSRTFILLFICGILLCLLFSGLSKQLSWKKILILFGIFIVLSGIIVLFNGTLIKSLINRFISDNEVSDGSRIKLMKMYFSKLFSRPVYTIFGVGCSNAPSVLETYVSPHSNFVQLICGYGVVGFLLLNVGIIYSFIKTKNKINLFNYRFGFYFPIIFGFLGTLTNQIFFPTGILVAFVPAIICCALNNKNQELEINENLN